MAREIPMYIYAVIINIIFLPRLAGLDIDSRSGLRIK